MNALRTIVVGHGVQGRKRRAIADGDCVAVVDPVSPEAEFRRVADVPLGRYDAACVCTPDAPKVELLRHLLSHGKHVLVEKPLHVKDVADLDALEKLSREHKAVLYTAYNHRFEPHYVKMAETIRSGMLGRIYGCRMFYGNGTARLVRDSDWRDQGAGVLPDLGSHLLDTVRFWFGDIGEDFRVISASRFENHAPDHVVIGSESAKPKIELEMTLLSWRNHFTCDVLAEKGSAHIRSLCKWGPSSFTLRGRVLPSGRPPEETVTLTQDDPTWALEYAHFKALCATGKPSDLSGDRYLHRVLTKLGADAMREATA
jgi:scyllo-inositol 2-dehydrogenase (NADP+)